MSTTLANCLTELSKQIGDYWSGTTTSLAGATTSVVDTALKAKANDWITDDAYDRITSGTNDGEERKISALDNSSGTLTTIAHTNATASGVTYEVHRLFTASEKRRALVYAARTCFPHIFEEIRDETLTSGNWLMNGNMEKWTLTTTPDNFAATTVTAAQNTTAPYYTRGSSSCKLSTAAGYLGTTDTLQPHLRGLRGKTVTFKCKAWCDTASALRLGILYDGTNLEYSSYHPGTSNWVDQDGEGRLEDFLWVEKQIDTDATSIAFRAYLASAAATAYVDDLRVIGPSFDRVYISTLGLHRGRPHQVLYSSDQECNQEPWTLISGWKVGSDGWLYLPSYVPVDQQLRVLGIGYLDFLASGVSSTAWTATIDIDAPQTDILVAQAILYLYTEMALPNFTTGDRKDYGSTSQYWQQELQRRKAAYGMTPPAATIHWR